MPRILTIDDSRAIRSIVSKQVRELGLEVDEAENGEEGLSRLEECSYDLVLLDVTMPVLDGPGMLEKLRGRGDQTPVLMLTSESKRGVISSVMKLGIDDYILKPFKPDELRAKILKSLQSTGSTGLPVASAVPASVAAPTPPVGEAPARGAGSKQFTDLLAIDDKENVHKKLRSLLPQHISFNGVVSAGEAITTCQERIYRVVLLDTDIPDVDSAVLMSQLRVLQPHAPVLALGLRSAAGDGEAEKEALAGGFDGVMFKPFGAESVEDFLAQHFDSQDLLQFEENVARVTAYQGREDRVKRYFSRIEKLMGEFVSKVADACYDELVFDLTQIPAQPKETPALVIAVGKLAQNFGLQLQLVGSPEVKHTLNAFTETASLPWTDAA